MTEGKWSFRSSCCSPQMDISHFLVVVFPSNYFHLATFLPIRFATNRKLVAQRVPGTCFPIQISRRKGFNEWGYGPEQADPVTKSRPSPKRFSSIDIQSDAVTSTIWSDDPSTHRSRWLCHQPKWRSLVHSTQINPNKFQRFIHLFHFLITTRQPRR